MSKDPIQSFAAMLRGALGNLLAPDATSIVEMFDENGIMEFPFAPKGGVTRFEGRPALVDYLSNLGKMVDIQSMTVSAVHLTIDPAIVILEFDGVARSVATGGSYHQSYISVIRVANGRIVHYRDYWNPLVVVQLMQDAEASPRVSVGGDVDER